MLPPQSIRGVIHPQGRSPLMPPGVRGFPTPRSKHNAMKIYPITPCPKPRMTRADKWKQRPEVLRYRDFCDLVRWHKVEFASGVHIVFVLPMPASWSKKKKMAMVGMSHQAKPDLDNLIKALGDAVYQDDSHLWKYSAEKVWGTEGKIIIYQQVTTGSPS